MLLLLPTFATATNICFNLTEHIISVGAYAYDAIFRAELSFPKRRIMRRFAELGHPALFVFKRHGNHIDDDQYRAGLKNLADALETHNDGIPGSTKIHTVYIGGTKDVIVFPAIFSDRSYVAVAHDAPADSLITQLSARVLEHQIADRMEGPGLLRGKHVHDGKNYVNVLELLFDALKRGSPILKQADFIYFTDEPGIRVDVISAGDQQWTNLYIPIPLPTESLLEEEAKDLLGQ